MHVVRFAQALGYSALGHHDKAMVRLQEREASPSSDLWIGVSDIAPGGSTTLSSSPQEKMYVALDGTLDVSDGGKWDCCRIAHQREPQADQQDGFRGLLVMPLSADER
jgi:hypothetical protein